MRGFYFGIRRRVCRCCARRSLACAAMYSSTSVSSNSIWIASFDRKLESRTFGTASNRWIDFSGGSWDMNFVERLCAQVHSDNDDEKCDDSDNTHGPIAFAYPFYCLTNPTSDNRKTRKTATNKHGTSTTV
jgi:hypothetical protein